MVHEDLELLLDDSSKKRNIFMSFLAWLPKAHDPRFNRTYQLSHHTIARIKSQKNEYFLALLDLWIMYAKDSISWWAFCYNLILDINVLDSLSLLMTPAHTQPLQQGTLGSAKNSMHTMGQITSKISKGDVHVIPANRNHIKNLRQKKNNIKMFATTGQA